KSATGYPLLANDPHLQLNLPSIWYQVQLAAPGVNVYGVSIPGTPFAIIGFNERVAWGVTNVAADVLDWYQLKFKDNTRREYWHDGRWKPVRRVVERIKRRQGHRHLAQRPLPAEVARPGQIYPRRHRPGLRLAGLDSGRPKPARQKPAAPVRVVSQPVFNWPRLPVLPELVLRRRHLRPLAPHQYAPGAHDPGHAR
nr:hypothetical protein [Tanacetum cinerariifolium]